MTYVCVSTIFKSFQWFLIQNSIECMQQTSIPMLVTACESSLSEEHRTKIGNRYFWIL